MSVLKRDIQILLLMPSQHKINRKLFCFKYYVYFSLAFAPQNIFFSFRNLMILAHQACSRDNPYSYQFLRKNSVHQLHSIPYLLNIYLLSGALHLSFMNFILPPCILSRPFCKSVKVILNSQPFLLCTVILSSQLPAICMASKAVSPFHHSSCLLLSMYLYEKNKWEKCNFCVSDVGLCVRNRMR